MSRVFFLLLSLFLFTLAPSSYAQQQAPYLHRTTITSANVPATTGPYSQAVEVGDVMYASGQLGIDPASNLPVYGGVGAETRQAMSNIRVLLQENGYDLEDIVQVDIYLTDLSYFEEMNAVYGSYFFENPPARSVAQVEALPQATNVQISVVAVRSP